MRSIALKYGSYMFIGFVVFFFLMDFFGMTVKVNLRIFNGVIHLTFIYLAIKEFSKKYPDFFGYLSGIAAGMWSSFVGVLAFAVFQLIYLHLDPDLMEMIQTNAPGSAGQYLNPFSSALIIFMEGIIVSLLGSYFFMRVIDMQKS